MMSLRYWRVCSKVTDIYSFFEKGKKMKFEKKFLDPGNWLQNMNYT